MRSRFPAGVLALVSALVCSEASALDVSAFELERDGALLTDVDRMTLVNRARCACGESIELTIGFSARTTGVAGDVVLMVGDRCVDSDGRLDDSCTELWRTAADDVNAVETFDLALEKIAGGCSGGESTTSLVILVDADDDDYWTELHETSIGIDLDAPAEPNGEELVAGEGVVEVAFSDDDDAEVETRYQVLCRQGDEPVLSDPPTAAFESEADLCGTSSTSGPREAYVCAEASDTTASVTIEDLVDGETYIFEVVAVDEAGNHSDVVRIGTATPAPEEDLWERYKRSGGVADGGHCFIATAAFGAYDATTVRWLRVFRDTVLAPSKGGRRAITAYYAASPAAAETVRSHPVLRAGVRPVLERLRWFALSVMLHEGGSR